MTAEAVRSAVSSIVSKWKGGPRVVVVDSYVELPREIVLAIERTQGPAALKGVYGQGTDTVYLIADQITSPGDARRTLAHEAVGHYAMEHMLGDEYADIIAKVWLLMSRDPKVRKIAETVRAQYEGADERTVAEEVLANMAENKVQRGVMNEVVAAVRRFLRGLGLRLPYSRVEVYSLLRRANRWLSSGAGAVARGTHPASDAIMFRIDGQATGPTAAQHRMKRFVDVLRSGKRRMPIDRVFRLLTAPAGGINPTTGEWRHAPRFQRAARKLVRETRPTGRMQWLDPVIETMRHGWLDRYGTPEEFIRREQRATVDKRRIEQEGVALVEALVDEELTVEEAARAPGHPRGRRSQRGTPLRARRAHPRGPRQVRRGDGRVRALARGVPAQPRDLVASFVPAVRDRREPAPEVGSQARGAPARFDARRTSSARAASAIPSR